MAAPLRVCIEARIGDHAGGIQQFVLGLASGLAGLPDGEEEYLFLCGEEEAARLRPYLGAGPRCRTVPAKPPATLAGRLRRIPLKAANSVAKRGALARAWRREGLPPPRRSDGTAEATGAAVMHHAMQDAFLTRLPSVYHPHDLQHLHLPELFPERERVSRELRYRLFCERARFVAVASSWTKEDLVRQYGLPPGKVVVIPLAPANEAYAVPAAAEVEEVRRRLALPERFVYYPAQTWPHKNHAALIEAVARLRAEGLQVPFVSSGRKTEHHAALAERARALGVGDLVTFLGFVSPHELQALYRLCTAVVVPSLFEAASFPLWEAMLAGAPAACSGVTSLARQAGDAALVFDPRDPGAVAAAVRRLWTDAALRAELSARGRASVARFTWRETALRFRAVYRKVAGRAGPADLELLAAAPLL